MFLRKANQCYNARMARGVLFVFGAILILWGGAAIFAGALLPEWLGLGPERGAQYIEFHAINSGLWPALGIFALLGAVITPLRIPAILALLVCASGAAFGRVFAMVQRGADPDISSIAIMAAEFAIIAGTAFAYVSEQARVHRENKAALRALQAERDRRATEPARPKAKI